MNLFFQGLAETIFRKAEAALRLQVKYTGDAEQAIFRVRGIGKQLITG